MPSLDRATLSFLEQSAQSGLACDQVASREGASMLALGGLRARFGRGACPGFKEIAKKSYQKGLRKNEAEVVSDNGNKTIAEVMKKKYGLRQKTAMTSFSPVPRRALPVRPK